MLIKVDFPLSRDGQETGIVQTVYDNIKSYTLWPQSGHSFIIASLSSSTMVGTHVQLVAAELRHQYEIKGTGKVIPHYVITPEYGYFDLAYGEPNYNTFLKQNLRFKALVANDKNEIQQDKLIHLSSPTLTDEEFSEEYSLDAFVYVSCMKARRKAEPICLFFDTALHIFNDDGKIIDSVMSNLKENYVG